MRVGSEMQHACPKMVIRVGIQRLASAPPPEALIRLFASEIAVRGTCQDKLNFQLALRRHIARISPVLGTEKAVPGIIIKC